MVCSRRRERQRAAMLEHSKAVHFKVRFAHFSDKSKASVMKATI
jgi:uncharacterized protein (TIGR00369 family)